MNPMNNVGEALSRLAQLRATIAEHEAAAARLRLEEEDLVRTTIRELAVQTDTPLAAMILVDSTDIAAMCGVSLPAVSNWKRRHADFPSPVYERNHIRLYDLQAVRVYLALRSQPFDESALKN